MQGRDSLTKLLDLNWIMASLTLGARIKNAKWHGDNLSEPRWGTDATRLNGLVLQEIYWVY